MAGAVTLSPTVEAELAGDTLTLTCRLVGQTRSKKGVGRNLVLASTGGNQKIGNISVGLNVYRPVGASPRRDES
jgi:hypothetical protein